MSRRFGAIILAGGASKRMGSPKAWLKVGERTLLAHVVDQVREVVQDVVVVGRADLVLPELAGVVRVDDDPGYEGGGPLVGVLAGLERLAGLGTQVAFVGTCDSPLMSAAHVRAVVERAGVSGAIPRQADGRTHPLAGAVAVQPALEHAAALLARGERSARALHRALESEVVEDPPDPRALTPCNTPEDFAAALQLLGSRA